MKKVLILFGVVIILLLSSCTNSEPVSRVELSEEDIAALRMEYPYCDTSNIMADIEILGIVDQLKAEVNNLSLIHI